ncbi:hypothetical protein RM780_07650 [Streptomyces sp. DSM 44917]|uniref:Uncharacterized protein n=1 Tax=Streptomyces boetiae TaxID=3075541 RepID=A0ABU2L5W7_9ACTN|nr:hypothetical protein [Streptomyces sp. DSM 44917]MDT0306836.1 hypothetical protein [Streptomyces sp. DSM 44917]
MDRTPYRSRPWHWAVVTGVLATALLGAAAGLHSDSAARPPAPPSPAPAPAAPAEGGAGGAGGLEGGAR